jgi:hypothetical protein
VFSPFEALRCDTARIIALPLRDGTITVAAVCTRSSASDIRSRESEARLFLFCSSLQDRKDNEQSADKPQRNSRSIFVCDARTKNLLETRLRFWEVKHAGVFRFYA